MRKLLFFFKNLNIYTCKSQLRFILRQIKTIFKNIPNFFKFKHTINTMYMYRQFQPHNDNMQKYLHLTRIKSYEITMLFTNKK